MTYVDGFVLLVPKDKLDQYKAMAGGAGPIWMDHGVLAYKECVMEDGEPNIPDDAPPGFTLTRFADLAGTKEGETVIFAFITYKSRAHRDEVNAKVMSDPRMKEACGGKDFDMPFDPGRMAYGGFQAIVDL